MWNPSLCECECNPSLCECECNKACKIDEYLDTKNFSLPKRLIDKLALECEDKILNTTEPLLNDKKWHVQKAIILFTLFHR